MMYLPSRLLLCGSLLILTTGCSTVTTSEVVTFGKAARSLSDDTVAALHLATEQSVEWRVHEVASDPGQGPTDATFTSAFTKDMNSAIAARLKLIELLGRYADALQSIAAADFSAEIDQATIELRGALGKLNQTHKDIGGNGLVSSDDLDLIAAAVDGIGRTVTEALKRKAIKAIIEKTDPAIQKASRLIQDDLGPESDIAKYVSATASNIRGSMQQAYNLERTKPSSTYEKRLEALRNIHGQFIIEQHTPKLFEHIRSGTMAMAAAHAALKKGVASNDLSTELIRAAISDLSKEATEVRAFHKELKKEN